METIPLIGTAIVNGVHWVERLINSVDYPVDTFVIINNNGRDEISNDLDNLVRVPHPFIKKIKVVHMPTNIGCPGAWNLIIKSYLMLPFWIIVNHDIKFTPGFLEEMVAKTKDEEVGLVYGNKDKWNLGCWDLFLIKDWVIKTHGLFDENFYPAYSEDLDYIMRLLIKPVKSDIVSKPYLHGEETYETTGCQTIKVEPELRTKIDEGRILNENTYMINKWGPDWRYCNPYKTPFNKEGVDLGYSKYDLDFTRSKYIGF